MSSLSIKLVVAKDLQKELLFTQPPLYPPVHLDQVVMVSKTIMPLDLTCADGHPLPKDACGAINLFMNVDPKITQHIPEEFLPDAAIVFSRDGKNYETSFVQDPGLAKDWKQNMQLKAEQLLKESCKNLGCEGGTNCAFTRKER